CRTLASPAASMRKVCAKFTCAPLSTAPGCSNMWIASAGALRCGGAKHHPRDPGSPLESPPTRPLEMAQAHPWSDLLLHGALRRPRRPPDLHRHPVTMGGSAPHQIDHLA